MKYRSPEADPCGAPEPDPAGEDNDDPLPQSRMEAGAPCPDPTEPRAKPHTPLGWFQRRGTPISELLKPSIGWAPAQSCRGCRHLGEPTYVRGTRGDRRVRRSCPKAQHGYTDIDWPACASYDPLSASNGLLPTEAPPSRPTERTDAP